MVSATEESRPLSYIIKALTMTLTGRFLTFASGIGGIDLTPPTRRIAAYLFDPFMAKALLARRLICRCCAGEL